MVNPVSLAFECLGNRFATIHDAGNNYRVPGGTNNGYMGPTEWDVASFAKGEMREGLGPCARRPMHGLRVPG